MHLEDKASSYFQFVKIVQAQGVLEKKFVEIESVYPWSFLKSNNSKSKQAKDLKQGRGSKNSKN